MCIAVIYMLKSNVIARYFYFCQCTVWYLKLGIKDEVLPKLLKLHRSQQCVAVSTAHIELIRMPLVCPVLSYPILFLSVWRVPWTPGGTVFMSQVKVVILSFLQVSFTVALRTGEAVRRCRTTSAVGVNSCSTALHWFRLVLTSVLF